MHLPPYPRAAASAATILPDGSLRHDSVAARPGGRRG